MRANVEHPFLSVEVVDTTGHAWALFDNAPAPAASARLLEVTDRSPHEPTSGEALVYIDLRQPRNDLAFDRLVEARVGQLASITTTLHQIGWLVSGNCIGERTGAKLSCKLAYSWEGIPKSPFMSTVVVILGSCMSEQRLREDCAPRILARSSQRLPTRSVRQQQARKRLRFTCSFAVRGRWLCYLGAH